MFCSYSWGILSAAQIIEGSFFVDFVCISHLVLFSWLFYIGSCSLAGSISFFRYVSLAPSFFLSLSIFSLFFLTLSHLLHRLYLSISPILALSRRPLALLPHSARLDCLSIKDKFGNHISIIMHRK